MLVGIPETIHIRGRAGPHVDTNLNVELPRTEPNIYIIKLHMFVLSSTPPLPIMVDGPSAAPAAAAGAACGSDPEARWTAACSPRQRGR